jgi:ectoine hydroxylase-related dioxygenase (phytanoyl-CoA dioxygenase family)
MNSGCRVRSSEFTTLSRFDKEGFQIVTSVIAGDECDLLAAELTPLFEAQQKSAGSKIGGIRNLLRTNERVQQLAGSRKIISILEEAIGLRPFPVRAIFFDKNPDANWLVPWHQDLAVAVAARVDASGFTGWSIKDGVPHVHPPPEILEGMITLRLHLDDCGGENGALKIIAGSHRLGKLDAVEISNCAKSSEPVTCDLLKGDILLMRPLLLHASLPAKNPSHRRVLHIEYATRQLPDGLKWFEN